jgi:hypothetical protein
MKKRCNPHLVRQVHLKANSWRKAAQELNTFYQVNLPFLTWRDYGTGRRNILDPKIRAALMLEPRILPTCRDKPRQLFSRLLKRMAVSDLQHWNDLRKERKYKAAYRFLIEIYSRNK